MRTKPNAREARMMTRWERDKTAGGFLHYPPIRGRGCRTIHLAPRCLDVVQAEFERSGGTTPAEYEALLTRHRATHPTPVYFGMCGCHRVWAIPVWSPE